VRQSPSGQAREPRCLYTCSALAGDGGPENWRPPRLFGSLYEDDEEYDGYCWRRMLYSTLLTPVFGAFFVWFNYAVFTLSKVWQCPFVLPLRMIG
jgi:hypothetical protein